MFELMAPLFNRLERVLKWLLSNLWSVRVGEHYRALGVDVKEGIYWFLIGPHAEYDRIVG
jgi:hypothetical protein